MESLRNRYVELETDWLHSIPIATDRVLIKGYLGWSVPLIMA